MRSVLVVGASLAGLRAAEALRAEGYDGRLTLVGDEAHKPYDRPPLSKGFLSGTDEPQAVLLRGADELDAEWLLGTRAVGADASAHQVRLEDGRVLDYEGLVVATGSSARSLPGLPTALPGLHLLRTHDDALRLREDLTAGPRRVVVIGAGFIGGELASTCLGLGLAVTVVDPAPLPLARPLGTMVAEVLATRHRAYGTDLRTGTGVTAVLGAERVEAVELSDGTRLEADVVVIAVGARPNTDWLDGSGIAVQDGVLCHPDLSSTSAPGVVACGDVVRFEHPRFGCSVRVEHWTHAVETAGTAARTLLGLDPRAHQAVPSFWTDQLGLKVQGVGLLSVADRSQVEDEAADELGTGLLASYWRQDELVGAVAFGGPKRLMKWRRELAAGALAP